MTSNQYQAVQGMQRAMRMVDADGQGNDGWMRFGTRAVADAEVLLVDDATYMDPLNAFEKEVWPCLGKKPVLLIGTPTGNPPPQYP